MPVVRMPCQRAVLLMSPHNTFYDHTRYNGYVTMLRFYAMLLRAIDKYAPICCAA